MVLLSRRPDRAALTRRLGFIACLTASLIVPPAVAQEAAAGKPEAHGAEAKPAPEAAVPVAAKPPVTDSAAAPQPTAPQPAPSQAAADAHQYCQKIAGAAADARFAYQTGQIKDLEEQLQAKIQELEAKEAQYRDAMARRDAAMKRAAETLVGIYAKMRPDAAAAQLSALDDDTAASVLSQLNPRVSSAILNEVTPDRAVQLINAIATPAGPVGKKS